MKIGELELDIEGYQLRRSGQPLRIERIPMELLLLLAGSRGKLVTREQVVSYIWGASHYIDSESAINTAIRKLRKVLGDDVKNPRFIETLPAKGYRLIAEKPEKAEPTGKDAQDSNEAHKLYLRGRHHWNKKTGDGYARALEFFQRSIDADAAYPAPYVGLSLCYIMLGIHGLRSAIEVYPRARAAALAALEIDPEMSEAYVALADISKGYDWDWAAAETHYRKALEFNPDDSVGHQWYAGLLSTVARHEEAVTEAEIARSLDPISVGTSGFVGWTLYRARRYADAQREAQETMEFSRGAPIAHWFLAHVYLELGDHDAAVTALLPTIEVTNESGMYVGLLAYAQARAGKRSDAENLLQALEKRARNAYISPFDLATAHLGLGDFSSVFDCLHQAYAGRVMRLTELNIALFDELRLRPEFASLLSAAPAFVLPEINALQP